MEAGVVAALHRQMGLGVVLQTLLVAAVPAQRGHEGVEVAEPSPLLWWQLGDGHHR